MPRIAAFGFCLMSIAATTAFGSIWENPEWAVVGTLDGSVSYDSDLTLVRGGPSALLIEASPEFTLERHNSTTQFDVNGGVKETEFVDSNQPFESDYSFSADFAFPKADRSDPRGLVIIPVFEMSAAWLRSSQPNEFLGARTPNDVTTIKGDGFLTLTGKLGLRGTAEVESVTYNSSALNDAYIGEGSIGLAYSETEHSQLSFNIGGILGHSVPNDPVFTSSDVRSKEVDITARIQGQITDKVTGSAYGGFGLVRYTGGYTKTNNLPVAGADLTWGIDPRRTIVLAAYSGAEYSPNGEAAVATRAFLSFTDVIISGWQLDLRTGPARYVYSREVNLRTDKSWNTGVSFGYQPSDRFRVYVSLDYNYQTSTDIAFRYGHEVVALGATYHF